MHDYQREFIEFALAPRGAAFGSFTLKSGRTSPYFFNAGAVDTGAGLAALGRFYAAAIVEDGLEVDVLLGPAYKGIPIAAATAVQLAEEHGRDVPWCFNRKEAKDHGEGGLIVGAPLDRPGARGRRRHHRRHRDPRGRRHRRGRRRRGRGIVVAIDRQERGTGETSPPCSRSSRSSASGCGPSSPSTTSSTYLEETGEHAEHLDAVRAYRVEHGVR